MADRHGLSEAGREPISVLTRISLDEAVVRPQRYTDSRVADDLLVRPHNFSGLRHDRLYVRHLECKISRVEGVGIQ
jgi:hypothetical protein